MKDNTYVKEYAELQYRTHNNLINRINLWSYGTNPESLQKWIFNKIQLQEHEKILELGCGTGQLWLDNYRKVPLNCSIILSDFSKNMLNTAKKSLKSLNLPIKYKVIDAEQIPYQNQIFDVVLGCHMLYHIPNIRSALISINRVLKPSGRFISTTISKRHIWELKSFLSEFGLYLEEKMKLFSEFTNETGKEILEPFFEEIEFYEYINPVNITSVDPLMRYIESIVIKEQYPEFQEIKPQIKDAIAKTIKKKSKFKITGIVGLFKASKPIQN